MALPLERDPITDRRLLMVQSLYRAGVVQTRAALAHRRILALVTFDLANETMLKLIATDPKADSKPPDAPFPRWVSLAADRLAVLSVDAELPGRVGIRDVHSLRNRAQHDGHSPSEETLDVCRLHTREFLWETARLVWDVDYDVLSASSNIQTEVCREQIQEAERLIAAGQFVEAARHARRALQTAARRATGMRFGYQMPRMSALSSYDDPTGVSRLGSELVREIGAVWEAIHALALGFDDAQQTRLRRFTGRQRGAMGTTWTDPEAMPGASDAEWALAYCTDTILALEQRFDGPLVDRSERAG